MFANCHTMRGMLFHHHGQKEINDVCHLMRRMLFHHHGQKVGVTVIILLHPLCQASFLALPNWVCWYWEDKFQLVDIYISLYQMKGLGCVLHGMHENRVIHISYSLICKWAEKNWSQWYKPEKRIYYIKQVNSVCNLVFSRHKALSCNFAIYRGAQHLHNILGDRSSVH